MASKGRSWAGGVAGSALRATFASPRRALSDPAGLPLAEMCLYAMVAVWVGDPLEMIGFAGTSAGVYGFRRLKPSAAGSSMQRLSSRLSFA